MTLSMNQTLRSALTVSGVLDVNVRAVRNCRSAF